MNARSSLDAALEGVRLMRREPRAVLVWACLWLAALTIAAIVVASGDQVVIADRGAARDLREVSGRFGAFAAVFVPLFLVVWAITTVAAFRAVLEPRNRAFFFLRVGADELRLAVITVVALAVVVVLGGVPAFLLFALVSPVMAALPGLARGIATAGAVTTVCVDVWLAVRLSLIAVETFAEGRFHLSAYWPLVRGRFWFLLAGYAIYALMMFVFLAAIGFGGIVLQGAQTAIGAPDGADPGRRALLLGLAGLWALLATALFTVPATLLCACQAYAFRTIAAARSPFDRDSPVIRSEI
ncbi:MAG: hypothetical protein ABI376_02735 [Caulobacteraceae bacterium]